MRPQLLLLTFAAGSAFACSGVDGRSGLDEPFRVHDATFYAGELPGTPPVVVGSGEEQVPPITSSGTPSKSDIRQGLSSVRFTGQSTDDSDAVAVRFDGVGTGYWILPTLYEDVQTPNTLIWSLVADFQLSFEPGLHRMLTVAIDADGNAGTQSEMTVCVNSLVPDNGNACYPTQAPPGVVFSLEWDAAADLDLALVMPGGEIIDWRTPVSGTPDASGNIDLGASGVGKLQRDGNADCQIDGRQREDIVFQASPVPGTYLVYANLNRACGEAHVTYDAAYYARTRDGDSFGQARGEIGAGTLLPRQAGAKLGTFVGDITVN